MGNGQDVYSQPTINAVVWVMTTLATISLVLRLNLRLTGRHVAGWDDVVIAASGLVNLATAIMVTVAVSYGIDDVSQSSLAIAGHTNLVASALGILSIVIPKLAVAILLVRLLNPTRTTTVTLIGSSVIAIVLGILVVIVTFAQCKPTASLWDPNLLQERVCWNPNVLVDISFVGGAYAAFLDLAFAVYPVVIFSRLRISFGRKVIISMLMGLGMVTSALSFYKTSRLSVLAKNDRAGQAQARASILLWSAVEGDASTFFACIPTLNPYYDKVQRFLSSVEHTINKEKTNKSYQIFSTAAESGDHVELVPQQQGQNRSLSRHTTSMNITKTTEVFVENERAATAAKSEADNYFSRYGLVDV